MLICLLCASVIFYLWKNLLWNFYCSRQHFKTWTLGMAAQKSCIKGWKWLVNCYVFVVQDSLKSLMAARLQQLQSKACQAKQYVTKHGTTYYKQLLEQNKQYVKEPATVETCSELSKQLFYTHLARLHFFFLCFS